LNRIIALFKKITKPMMGLKAFHSATAAIDGIETAHRIQKGQLSENMPAYKQSMALSGQFYPPIRAALHFMNICDRTIECKNRYNYRIILNY